MYEINNFTQKSEELTEKRNQTQEQLIKGKYLSLLPPLFCCRVCDQFSKSNKRRKKYCISEKHTSIVKVMLREQTSCDNQPVCFNVNFISLQCRDMCMVNCFMLKKTGFQNDEFHFYHLLSFLSFEILQIVPRTLFHMLDQR